MILLLILNQTGRAWGEFTLVLHSNLFLRVVVFVCRTRVAVMKEACGSRPGWSAVLCLHVSWLVWSGLVKSLGVMLPTLQEQFATQSWLIGWLVAIVNAVANIIGATKLAVHFLLLVETRMRIFLRQLQCEHFRSTVLPMFCSHLSLCSCL